MDKELFGSLFKVGDELNSGGPPERANAARLEILAIEEKGIRYKSIGSKKPNFFPYTELDIVIAGFDKIDPNSIKPTIQRVYLDAGLKAEDFTENYEYGFAREFLRRREKFESRRHQQ